MNWSHKHILDIRQFTVEEINYLFSVTEKFSELNTRQVKKVPVLKGKSVILFFAEPSTRTKISFDKAGKRLSADTFSLGESSSSLQKGESLRDTAYTLQAMNPDALVLRHGQSGAAHYLSQILDTPVINAGDGWHAHPTQALLDAYTLSRYWNDFQNKNILYVGDIAYSRVARSGIELFSKMGANIRLCAPKTLLPPYPEKLPVQIFTNLQAACEDVHAVVCLRLQTERQKSALLPDLREYSANYCLGEMHLRRAHPDVLVMHPGPMNRGVEIDSRLTDNDNCIILNQVFSGVSVRMALLYLLLAGGKSREGF